MSANMKSFNVNHPDFQFKKRLETEISSITKEGIAFAAFPKAVVALPDGAPKLKVGQTVELTPSGDQYAVWYKVEKPATNATKPTATKSSSPAFGEQISNRLT